MLSPSVSHKDRKDENCQEPKAKIKEQRHSVDLIHVRPNVRVDVDHKWRGQRVVNVTLPPRVSFSARQKTRKIGQPVLVRLEGL